MRKRLLGILAVLTVLALLVTACGKDKTEQQPTQPTQTQPAPAKEGVFYGAWPYDVPPKSHWNVYGAGGLVMGGSPFNELMMNPLMMYYWATDKWEPLLATEYKVDAATNNVTVTLRKGVKFSDGTDFKAQDIINTSYILKAQNNALWQYVDKIDAKDDHTVVFHMSQPSTVGLRYILKMQPQPASVYGQWAAKLKPLIDAGKAAASDEVKAVMKELDAFRPADFVVSGVYKIDTASITEAQMTMKKVATAWNANTVKFDKIVIHQGETAQVTPLVLDKKVDFATHAFPVATAKQFQDLGIRVVRYPTYSGPSLFFNNDIYPLNVPEVRQAIAYAINRTENGIVALGPSGVGAKYMAGFSDNLVTLWMNDADVKKLNQYAYDPKKAEEALTKKGFKKGADGIWVDDKGKKMEFELSVPSDYADWSASADNVAQQLNKFGIKITVRGVPSSQHPTDVNAGKFQIAYRLYGSSIPHPSFGFRADLITYNGGGDIANKEKPGQNYPLKQKWSGGEIDFKGLITKSGQGLDLAPQKQLTGQLALAFNELMPIVPLYERYTNSPALDKVHVIGWPKDDDPILKNGGADNFVTLMILTGKLEAAK